MLWTSHSQTVHIEAAVDPNSSLQQWCVVTHTNMIAPSGQFFLPEPQTTCPHLRVSNGASSAWIRNHSQYHCANHEILNPILMSQWNPSNIWRHFVYFGKCSWPQEDTNGQWGDDLHLFRRMAGPQKSSSNMANFSGWTCEHPTGTRQHFFGKLWKKKGLACYDHLYMFWTRSAKTCKNIQTDWFPNRTNTFT